MCILSVTLFFSYVNYLQQSELPLEYNFKQVVYKTLGRCNCISFKAGFIA